MRRGDHESVCYVGEAFADGEDIVVINTRPRDILHRVFRGDRDGLCVLDPPSFSAAVAGEVESYELVTASITIGGLIEGKEEMG